MNRFVKKKVKRSPIDNIDQNFLMKFSGDAFSPSSTIINAKNSTVDSFYTNILTRASPNTSSVLPSSLPKYSKLIK